MNQFASAVFTAATFVLVACSSKPRHATIIYDEAWSSAAGVRNLACAPDLKASCEREAMEGEDALSRRLPEGFATAPECKNVQFLVIQQIDLASGELEKRFGSDYWRLRVDFHPRLAYQPFSLGRGEKRADIGGDDVEHNAAFICEAAKHNGVIAIW